MERSKSGGMIGRERVAMMCGLHAWDAGPGMLDELLSCGGDRIHQIALMVVLAVPGATADAAAGRRTTAADDRAGR